MSSTRRDTAAARAALARRRQRGIFTPSPTNNTNGQQQPSQPRSTSSGGRPKSLPTTTQTPATTRPKSESAAASRGPAGSTGSGRPRSAASDPLSTQKKRPVNGTHQQQSPSTSSTTKRPPPLPASNNVRFQSSTDQPREMKEAANNDIRSGKQNERQNGHAPQQDEVVEEPEPLVTDEVLDAKCLSYGSLVKIRSQAGRLFLAVSSQQTSRRNSVAMTNRNTEAQVIEVAKGDETASNDSVVRYGDTIVLGDTTQDCSLGVRMLSTNEMSGVSYELGFSRSPQKWTVLRGGRVLLVGSAALSNGTPPKRGKTAAVRSGDWVVLRHAGTGGLLALDDDGALTLVTDSYDSNAVRSAMSSDASSPLDRVQHHDRIVPASNELFQFVNSDVPPCPQWTDESSRRMYENGSYLSRSGRNNRDEATKLKLFGPCVRDGRKSLRGPLKSGDPATQQKLLLDEVIGSLFGLEGHYVRVDEKSQFQVREPQGVAFDTSLKNLVSRMLPLSTAFVKVRSFVSVHRPGYEYGFVVQAACEAIDVLLQEYLAFASRIEELLRVGDYSEITMKKLHVSIQAPLRKMAVLEHVTKFIREQKGGALLNALHELKTRVFAGDAIAQQVLQHLLMTASVPYFKMLEAWLESGVIDDPFGEFMIEMGDQPFDKPGDSVGLGYEGDVWNDMFRVRSEHVLNAVLSSPVVREQILLTGKYWNAVQLCPQDNEDDLEDEEVSKEENTSEHLNYGTDSAAMSTYVHKMYQSASHQLLRLLVEDFGLMETLLTMKRYFLIHQGDFLMDLFDAAEDELLQELSEVSRGRVQHWLSLCVHLTEPHGGDASSSVLPLTATKIAGPLKGSMLRCSFSPESLLDHLDALHAESGGIDAREPKTPSRHPYGISNKGVTGVESFVLQFDQIPFPTSLIISQRALSSYQLLFRHLFFAKHVERRLVGVWLDHQMMKQFQSLRGAMGPTYCLRQRMLHFMQNFIYYMMFEVIDPNWLEMENAIRRLVSDASGTVDDIVKIHNKFLDTALAECLLTNRDLIRTLTKLMTTCLLFSDQLKRFMEATKIADENQVVANQKRSKIQRNLNDPTNTHRKQSKKALRKAMTVENDERRMRMHKQTARVERELSNESYSRMIARFDEVFSENLGRFMSQLLAVSNQHHSQKANLCIRLDYNGYVTRQMGLQ